MQNCHCARNTSINSSRPEYTVSPPAMAGHVSTKLFIQHPEDANIRLCGVLEQLSPDQPTHGRKIALVSCVTTRF